MTQFAFRTNWRGQLILRKLIHVREEPYSAGFTKSVWVDAEVEDLLDFYTQDTEVVE